MSPNVVRRATHTRAICQRDRGIVYSKGNDFRYADVNLNKTEIFVNIPLSTEKLPCYNLFCPVVLG